jgi:hypothetical protein
VDGRRGWAALAFTAAALMKIPTPLTVPAGLGLVVLSRPAERRDVRAYAALATPFVADVAWLAYHYAVTGWMVWRPGRALAAPIGAWAHVRAAGVVADWLLLGQWRWMLLAGAVAGAAWIRMVRKEHVRLRPLAPLLAPIGVGIVLFAAVGEFGLRYGIYLLPGYVVACLVLARRALRRGVWLAAGCAAAFALFATTWHPKAGLTSSYTFRPDENLTYLDTIDLGLKTAHWLEEKHPDAEIYGAGPEAYELAEPWQGYVTRPLRFAWCDHFTRHPGTEQLVIVHGYHPQQPLCRQLVQTLGAEALIRFESNGKWLELYRVPPM